MQRSIVNNYHLAAGTDKKNLRPLYFVSPSFSRSYATDTIPAQLLIRTNIGVSTTFNYIWIGHHYSLGERRQPQASPIPGNRAINSLAARRKYHSLFVIMCLFSPHNQTQNSNVPGPSPWLFFGSLIHQHLPLSNNNSWSRLSILPLDWAHTFTPRLREPLHGPLLHKWFPARSVLSTLSTVEPTQPCHGKLQQTALLFFFLLLFLLVEKEVWNRVGAMVVWKVDMVQKMHMEANLQNRLSFCIMHDSRMIGWCQNTISYLRLLTIFLKALLIPAPSIAPRISANRYLSLCLTTKQFSIYL